MHIDYSFIASSPLDIITGMLVYTIPFKEHSYIDIDRPYGFEVSERVLSYDTKSLFIVLTTTYMHNPNPRYVQCSSPIYIVKKVSMDTLSMCKTLTKLLNCSKCLFLGLKEANAIAYQVALLYGCPNVVPVYVRDKNLEAIFWQCRIEQLTHHGNRFRLLVHVRNIETFIRRLNKLKALKRILNFFGYQRFGSKRPISHLIGRAIVKREWDEAIRFLCNEAMPHENAKIITSRIAWAYSVNSNRSLLTMFPERRVCYSTTSSLRALQILPKELLTLYVNAYQSYLFNLALSCTWITKIRDLGYDLDSSIQAMSKLTIPLIGYRRLAINDSVVEYCYERILKSEMIDSELFNISELKIRVGGGYRAALFEVLDIHYRITNKERQVVTLEVELPRGTYVTTLLRELAKNPIDFT